MKCYKRLLAAKPITVLSIVGVFACIASIIPFFIIELPDFEDPVLGFEARGTEISNRLTAWKNLIDATKPSGMLTVNPREIIQSKNNFNKDISKITKHHDKNKENKLRYVRDLNNQFQNNNEIELDNNYKKPKSNKKQTNEEKNTEQYNDHFFCGPLRPDYAHFVVSQSKPDESLFSLQSLLSMCKLEENLILSTGYNNFCPTKQNKDCCPAWSLPNYVALIGGHQKCSQITENDVNKTLNLLRDCSEYYHNYQLVSNCFDTDLCPAVPDRCKQLNIPYIILHYLTENNFFTVNDYNISILHNSMMFLPITSKSDSIRSFRSLKDINVDGIYIPAMDLGIKYVLFEDTILEDTWLLGLGALSVFLCILLYTGSLFITFMIASAMLFSLGLSYFAYTIVFNIKFFPFMNLLAIVLAIGIGADDAFILVKVWNNEKLKFKQNLNLINISGQTNVSSNTEEKKSLVLLIDKVLQNASPSMLVTSLTTGAALYTLFFSNITAIRCFGIFSGTTVLANYLVMMSWMPAAILLSENFKCNHVRFIGHCSNYKKKLKLKLQSLGQYFENFIINSVIKYRYFWMIFLGLAGICSVFIVLYKPKLKLPDSQEFQLFDVTHPFEQYDILYRDKFRFEESIKGNNVESYLPLRFIWGVLPEDNGNYLNPKSKGSLVFDNTFNLSSTDAQRFLLSFCRNLRGQDFYQSTVGPLLLNCFIENFITWMNRRCIDVFSEKDLSPCCETTPFPYPSTVFDKCLIEAIGDIYETPAQFFTPGVAGPKFSLPYKYNYFNSSSRLFSESIAKALVVEYNSNIIYSLSYEDMRKFYHKVNDWTKIQMDTAPETMKGWFISELDFYDLQETLSTGTYIAIALSIIIALMILFLVTLNVLLSLYAILTVACVIFTTVATLIFCGWKLNILESITVSTAIGLAVDFSLHYSLHYRLAPQSTDERYRENCARYSLKQMCGPTTMAMLTTLLVGVIMLPSRVLAYIQISIFLIVITIISWIYSTFFLGSLLYTIGPQYGFCQFNYSTLWCFKKHKSLPISLPNASVCSLNDTETNELSSFQNR